MTCIICIITGRHRDWYFDGERKYLFLCQIEIISEDSGRRETENGRRSDRGVGTDSRSKRQGKPGHQCSCNIVLICCVFLAVICLNNYNKEY